MTSAIEEAANLRANLDMQVDEMLAVVTEIGGPYRQAREDSERLRKQARPLVIALARAGVEQTRIADALQVTRETIRRIEMDEGIDRGDPRARPGSRIGKAARRRQQQQDEFDDSEPQQDEPQQDKFDDV